MNKTASDGLRARFVGQWTLEKLFYVERYAKAFMGAMAPKRSEGKWESLVYLDLLSGPGLCIEKDTGREHSGSALLALNVQPAFDRLYFADVSKRNISALGKRISQTDHKRVRLEAGDCNNIVKDFISEISTKALGLAFLDPEGFEVKFETIKILATRRIDILYLFPSGIGIKRNYQSFLKRAQCPMDDVMGGRNWRDQLLKETIGIHDFTQHVSKVVGLLVKHFREQMATLNYYSKNESQPLLVNDRNSPMYHLLFFSKHKAGLNIWKGIKKIEPGGQRVLPLN